MAAPLPSEAELDAMLARGAPARAPAQARPLPTEAELDAMLTAPQAQAPAQPRSLPSEAELDAMLASGAPRQPPPAEAADAALGHFLPSIKKPDPTAGEAIGLALKGAGKAAVAPILAGYHAATAPVQGDTLGEKAISVAENVMAAPVAAIHDIKEDWQAASVGLPSWLRKPINVATNAAEDVVGLATGKAAFPVHLGLGAAKVAGTLAGQVKAGKYPFEKPTATSPGAQEYLRGIYEAPQREAAAFGGGVLGGFTANVVNPEVADLARKGDWSGAQAAMGRAVGRLPEELAERPVSTILGPYAAATGAVRGVGKAVGSKALSEFALVGAAVKKTDAYLQKQLETNPTGLAARVARAFGGVAPGGVASLEVFDKMLADEMNAFAAKGLPKEAALDAVVKKYNLTPEEAVGLMRGELPGAKGAIQIETTGMAPEAVADLNAAATNANATGTMRQLLVHSPEWTSFIAKHLDTQPKRDAFMGGQFKGLVLEHLAKPQNPAEAAAQARLSQAFSDPDLAWWRNVITEGGFELAKLSGVDPNVYFGNLGVYVANQFGEHIDGNLKYTMLHRALTTGEGQKPTMGGALHAKMTPEQYYFSGLVDSAAKNPVDIIAGTAARVVGMVAIAKGYKGARAELQSRGLALTPAQWQASGSPSDFLRLNETLIAKPLGDRPKGERYLFRGLKPHTQDPEFLRALGDLPDYYIHKSALEPFLHLHQEVQALPAYMKAWKWLHTVANVPYYQFFNAFDDYNRVYAATGFRPFHGVGKAVHDGALGDFAAASKPGAAKNMPLKLIEAANNRIFDGGFLTDLQQSGQSGLFSIQRAAGKAATPAQGQMSFLEKASRLPTAAYQGLTLWSAKQEQFRRYYTYLLARDHMGKSPAEAAKFVNEVMFDYSDLSPVMRAILGKARVPGEGEPGRTATQAWNAVSYAMFNPFLTYPQKATKWGSGHVYNHPFRAAGYQALNQGLQAAAAALEFDPTLEEDRKRFKAYMLSEANPLTGGQNVRLSQTEHSIPAIRRFVPDVELSIPRRSLGLSTIFPSQEALGLGAGPLEGLAHAISGVNERTGKSVIEDKNAPALQQAAEWVENLGRASLLPGNVGRLIKSLMETKALATGTRAYSPGTRRELTPFDIMRVLPIGLVATKQGEEKKRLDIMEYAIKKGIEKHGTEAMRLAAQKHDPKGIEAARKNAVAAMKIATKAFKGIRATLKSVDKARPAGYDAAR